MKLDIRNKDLITNLWERSSFKLMKLDIGNKDYQTIGKDLPDCSGKPRPAVWRQIPGPKLKQITVGPKVNLLFLQIPDV